MELNFSTTPVEVPVTIDNKKYILREATGDAVTKWKNLIMSKAKLGPDGKPIAYQAMADCEPILVSYCLVEKNNNTPVSVETIRSWPNRVQSALFEKAKEISEVDVENEEAAKNE